MRGVPFFCNFYYYVHWTLFSDNVSLCVYHRALKYTRNKKYYKQERCHKRKQWLAIWWSSGGFSIFNLVNVMLLPKPFLSKGAIHPWAWGCGRKAQQSPLRRDSPSEWVRMWTDFGVQGSCGNPKMWLKKGFYREIKIAYNMSAMSALITSNQSTLVTFETYGSFGTVWAIFDNFWPFATYSG